MCVLAIFEGGAAFAVVVEVVVEFVVFAFLFASAAVLPIFACPAAALPLPISPPAAFPVVLVVVSPCFLLRNELVADEAAPSVMAPEGDPDAKREAALLKPRTLVALLLDVVSVFLLSCCASCSRYDNENNNKTMSQTKRKTRDPRPSTHDYK